MATIKALVHVFTFTLLGALLGSLKLILAIQMALHAIEPGSVWALSLAAAGGALAAAWTFAGLLMDHARLKARQEELPRGTRIKGRVR